MYLSLLLRINWFPKLMCPWSSINAISQNGYNKHHLFLPIISLTLLHSVIQEKKRPISVNEGFSSDYCVGSRQIFHTSAKSVHCF